MIGIPAAQAIYPYQRRLFVSSAAVIAFLVLAAISSPIVGAVYRAHGGPILAYTLAVLVVLAAGVLTLVVISFGRMAGAERKIAVQLELLGQPCRVVPLVSVAAFRRWTRDQNVNPQLVTKAIAAWSQTGPPERP